MATKDKEVQKDSYGFIISFTTKANMSTTTSLKMRIRKGSSPVIEHGIDISNIIDPPTGKVNYIVEEGDFDTVTTVKMQIVDDTPGRYLPSTPIKIRVKDNI